jgi:hypothetical protein
MHTRTLLCTLAAFISPLALAAPGLADEATSSFGLAAGTCSKPIAIPVNNRPVHLMGAAINFYVGVGHVTILRLSDANHLLVWDGDDFFIGREHGASSAPNVHIMYLDSTQGKVDVQTAASGYIQVCNAADNAYSPVFGYLTFIY